MSRNNDPDRLPTWEDDGWGTPATRGETWGFIGVIVAGNIILIAAIYIVIQIIRRVLS